MPRKTVPRVPVPNGNPVHVEPPDEGADEFDAENLGPVDETEESLDALEVADDAAAEDAPEPPFIPPPPAAKPRPIQRLKDPFHGARAKVAAPVYAPGFPCIMYIGAKKTEQNDLGYTYKKAETPEQRAGLLAKGYVDSPEHVTPVE